MPAPRPLLGLPTLRSEVISTPTAHSPSGHDLKSATVLVGQLAVARLIEDGEHGKACAVVAEFSASGHQVEEFLEGRGEIAAGGVRACQCPARLEVAAALPPTSGACRALG